MFDLKKTIEYMFYLIIFLLPWQGVWIWREVFVGGFKWEYGTVGLYGVDVLILLLFILVFIDFFKDRNFQFSIFNFKTIFNNLILKFRNWDLIRNWKLKIRNLKYVLRFTFYILITWSFLSIAWSPDKILALYFSFKILLAVGLFWMAQKIDFNWRKLIFVLMLAGALQGGLATGQFLMQQDFASTLLGTSRHIVSAGGSSVIETESGRWFRAYGTFAHPNILGGYLAVILLIVLNYELRIRNYDKKNEFRISNFDSILNVLISKFRNSDLIQNSKFKIQNYGYVLSLTSYVLILSGLIASFSRSAWMVFAIGFILLFIFQKEKRRELAKLAVVFLGVGLIWLSAFSPLFFSRTAGQGRLEQKSFDDRTEYVLQAKEIIRNNFWLGVGAGNYTKAVAVENTQKPIWKIQPVHNVFLLVWSELGIIGLILFISILILTAYKLFENRKNNDYLYLILATVYLLLITDHWLWTSHFGLIFFFLILGVVVAEKYKSIYT